MTTPTESPSRLGRVPGARATTGFLAEFRRFLDQYGVIGLAIAFIIGQALTELVKAIVADLLLPLLTPAFRALGEGWQEAKYDVGPFEGIAVGHLLYAIIYFLIIALFVFSFVKFVLRQKEVKKI